MLKNQPRIVLVNDRPDEAFAVWQSLTEGGQATVQVDVVPNLAQVLDQLATGPVDVVVLELNLPDSRGLETLRRVRRAAGPTPVIVLTQGVDTALRAQALADGAEEVYDTHDIKSGLVSHSVQYLMERQRARLQSARLQLLMDGLPEAIVIADATGSVRFANPAARALFGHADTLLMGAAIDFMAPLDQALEIQLCRGGRKLRCEIRLATIAWDGLDARLASLKPLAARPAADAQHGPASPDEGWAAAADLRQQLLSTMRLQIRTKMQAFAGLNHEWADLGAGPFQRCYLANEGPQPQVLLALQATRQGAAA